MTALVLQSAPEPPPAWLAHCLASVQAWAAARGHAYRLCGDSLFDLLPDWVRAKTAGRPPVATDLARLVWARRALAEGWSRVIWLDADVLVLDPARLSLPEAPAVFGRETWVQYNRRGRLRAYRNVHNALCAFRPDASLLPFYAEAAEQALAGMDRIPADQVLGPQFLSALDNMIGLTATPVVGMISPAVAEAIAAGGGPALDKLRAQQPLPPAAVNLCLSRPAGVDKAALHAHILADSNCLGAASGEPTEPSHRPL